MTRQQERRDTRRRGGVVVALAALSTVLLILVILQATRPLHTASTIRITNDLLVFEDGSNVVFSVTGATDPVEWIVKRHDGSRLTAGTATGNAIVISQRLRTGYYTLTFGNPSSDVATVSFGVTGAKPSFDSFYGVQTLTAHADSLYRRDYERILSMLSDLGFSERRDSIYWNEYEQMKGQYQASPLHKDLVAIDTQNGTELLWTAGRQNKEYGESSFPSTPAEIRGYANYIDAVLTDLPQITRVEILNEFNSASVNVSGCGPTPTCYLKVLRLVYPQIKARHPDVEIIAGATSGVAAAWTEELLELGGGEYMDAYSIHPYNSTPDQLITHANRLRQDLYAATGDRKPVYFSEFGCSVLDEPGRGGRVADERLQAICVLYAFNAARAGDVKSLNYYNAINYGPNDHEQNFGLFHDADGNPSASAYQPKQAAIAFYVMRQKLEGYQYSHRKVLGGDDARVTSYVYTKENGDTLQVIWRSDRRIYVGSDEPQDDSDGVLVDIPTPDRAHTYVDSLMNDALDSYEDTTHVEHEVSVEPIYVESTNTQRAGIQE